MSVAAGKSIGTTPGKTIEYTPKFDAPAPALTFAITPLLMPAVAPNDKKTPPLLYFPVVLVASPHTAVLIWLHYSIDPKLHTHHLLLV